MSLCFKCSLFIVIIAVLIGIGPAIYDNMDQRQYNRRTTAKEAVIPNNLKGQIVIVTGASYAVCLHLSLTFGSVLQLSWP